MTLGGTEMRALDEEPWDMSEEGDTSQVKVLFTFFTPCLDKE